MSLENCALDRNSLVEQSIGQMMDHKEQIPLLGSHSSELKRNAAHKFQRSITMAIGSKRMHKSYASAGMYIIDQGRCKIVQPNLDGSLKKIICVIARNDSFGGSMQLKISVSLIFAFVILFCLQTMDYMGDVVAGGDIKPEKGKGQSKHIESELVCWYLPIEGLRRIPEFELNFARSNLKAQNKPFMQIAARKYGTNRIKDLQTY